jgi:hypothetical protein
VAIQSSNLEPMTCSIREVYMLLCLLTSVSICLSEIMRRVRSSKIRFYRFLFSIDLISAKVLIRSCTGLQNRMVLPEA